MMFKCGKPRFRSLVFTSMLGRYVTEISLEPPVLRRLRQGIPGTWDKLANRTSQTRRGQNQ